MKVVLISPSYGHVYGPYRALLKYGFLNQPLGLLYLARSLKEKGHEVSVIDAEAMGIGLSGTLDILNDARPDLIGISATSPEFPNAVTVATGIKKAMAVPIVLGGVHVTIFQKEVLEEHGCFDFGVVGEGEITLPELVDALEDGMEYPSGQGIIYRDGENVVQTAPRPLLEDLDELPFPDRRALLGNTPYLRNVPKEGYVPTASFMASRGCPYNCTYCAVERIPGWRHIRYRSAQRVVDELEHIVRELGIKHISFNDDVLTVNRNRTLAMCDEILRRGLEFTWEGLSRVDLVDRELLQAMKSAGFVRISYGIESGNPDILKSVNKNETHEQMREAYRVTREVGIVARGSVIIGLPYETKETVEDTFRFVNSVYGLDQVVVNILQPYPGTKVREMVFSGEGGSRVVADDMEALRRFGNASVEVNDLTRKDLIRLQKEGLLGFYLHPKRFLRNLSIHHPKAFLIDGLAFLASIFPR